MTVLKFTEEFGGRYIRVDLSNEHSIYGIIRGEDDERLILKDAKIVMVNGRMYDSPEVEIVRDVIVEIRESSPEDAYEEMKDRAVNLASDIAIYLLLAGAMFSFFMAFVHL